MGLLVDVVDGGNPLCSGRGFGDAGSGAVLSGSETHPASSSYLSEVKGFPLLTASAGSISPAIPEAGPDAMMRQPTRSRMPCKSRTGSSDFRTSKVGYTARIAAIVWQVSNTLSGIG